MRRQSLLALVISLWWPCRLQRPNWWDSMRTMRRRFHLLWWKSLHELKACLWWPSWLSIWSGWTKLQWASNYIPTCGAIYLIICCLVLFVFAVRLSERNGDTGKGLLEIYKVKMQKWVPACVNHWNPSTSPTMVCSMLGYNSVNSSRLTMSDSDIPIYPQNNVDTTAIWRMMQKKRTNLVKEFGSCPMDRHPVVDLTCSNYGTWHVTRHRQCSWINVIFVVVVE